MAQPGARSSHGPEHAAAGPAQPAGSDGHTAAIAWRADIDGLRAVAVLAVVLFHAQPALMPGGFTGVDIFFVISGFLITSIIVRERAEGRFSIAGFYERRIRRIFPALFTVIAASAFAGWFILAPGDYVSFARSAMAAMAFYSNFFFNRQTGYFAPAAETQPLLHTWSLGVEEQFYLVAPWGLLALLALSRALRGWIIALVFALSLGLSAYGVHGGANSAFYMPHTRAFELLAGAVLALGVFPPLRGRRSADVAALCGAVLIAISLFVLSARMPFPGLAALIPVLGAALLIHAGTHRETAVSRALSAGPAVFIGKISYSLYLWHWPLLAFAAYAFGDELTLPHKLALIALAILLSVASYRFVEQPARRATPLLTRKAVFAGGAAALLICLAMSETIIRTRGLPDRLGPQVAEFARKAQTRIRLDGICGFSDIDGRKALSGACFIGDRSQDAPRFILWGDSHAATLAPRLAQSAERAAIKGYVFGGGGCPPLFGLEAYGGHFRSCAGTARRVEALLENPAITHVVLHARWGLYATGRPSPNETRVRIRRFVEGRDAANAQAFAQRLRETVKRITAAGKKVIIIGPVPELEGNLPSTMIRDMMRGRMRDYALPKTRFTRRQADVLALLAELSALQDIIVLYPHNILCGEKSCTTVLDGMPLYFDDDHLGAAGVERISGLVDKAIAHIAGK